MQSNTLSFGAAIHDFWVSRYTTWRYYLDDQTGRRSLARMKQDAPTVVAMLDDEAHTALDSWAGNPSPAADVRASTKRKVGSTPIPINPGMRPILQ